MSPDQMDSDVKSGPDDAAMDGGPEQPDKLNLQVEIASPSACERHVTVTIPSDDVERYFDDAFSEMMPTASVPGFRPGRAPRKLVEGRFRKEIADQVKGSILMDSLSQISEEHQMTAIGEPELDLDAVEVPEDGPMTFEFDIEVRPEFDLPDWKGLKIKRPVREFSDDDVQHQLEQMLARYGQLSPHTGAAEIGDYLTANITSSADGKRLAQAAEQIVRVLPVLSLRDGQCDDFGARMQGVQAGEERTLEFTLSDNAPNEEFRGKSVTLTLEVLEVKQLKLPELNEEFLSELGEFPTEEALRNAIRADLERRLQYEQRSRVRQQISSQLTESANWELPPELLKRQSARELERAVMELRRSGFSEAEIRARENQLRQNSSQETARALKEHFILERIAEEEDVSATDADFESEIMLIAAQSGESPRRVRAQIDKRGLIDVLRNQIVERKVLETVEAAAKFDDEPYVLEKNDIEAVMFAAGGEPDEVPDAESASPAAEGEE